MMNYQTGPHNSNHTENPIHSLAAQFRMTHEETKSVISTIQEHDPSLESLKQPSVQMIIKQRKGRWVKEEEDFANFLSEEFLFGLSEIDNGVTKRAYLSSKLACTKMRISKKFKGQNTGKEVFTRRERRPDGRKLSPQEIHFYKRLHVELEKKFIKSVLKSVIKGGVKNTQKKQASPLPPCPPPDPQQHAAHSAQTPNASARTDGKGWIQAAETCTPAASHNLLGHGQLNLAFTSGFASPANTASIQLNGPAIMGLPASAGMQPPNIARQDPRPGVLSSQQAADPEPTQQFANQLNSMTAMTMQAPSGMQLQTRDFGHNGMPAFPNNTVENQGGSRTDALPLSQAPAFANDNQNTCSPNSRIQNQVNSDVVPMKTEGPRKRPILDLFGTIGYTFPLGAGGAKRFKPIPTSSQVVSTSPSEPSSNDESENTSSSNEASGYSNGVSTCGIVKPDNLSSHSDIPDLLSAFDKHVASMKNTVTVDITKNRPIPEDSHFFAGAGVGESPYITSQSFDELHKFLGKGLSTDKMSNLDLNQRGNSYHPVCNSAGYRSANASRQIGPPLSFGAYVPYVTQVPGAIQAQPDLNVRRYIDQPSSTSNSSDFTASD